MFCWAELLDLLEFASEVPVSLRNLWLSCRQNHHRLSTCSESSLARTSTVAFRGNQLSKKPQDFGRHFINDQVLEETRSKWC